MGGKTVIERRKIRDEYVDSDMGLICQIIIISFYY